ncbi:hypothetical protein GCM10007390_06160 [Persicitalea jodogahamensis]|uniref:Uncharacterized protein n=2 Tax=Persicitalea jodogahamensis TaxID=402147 RepID=A0A8J3G8H1_9BACT|nr:hypothetical protein GCM10007390_06160 [Persicitalea jodogahamensis]
MGKAELGQISTESNPISMVAFGGGLTAGVMNGGLYREGQQFAYPNLVAHQMGISDFQSPLFSEEEANGTGFLVLNSSKGTPPSWRKVENNLAKEELGNPPSISPFNSLVHNYGVPEGLVDALFVKLGVNNTLKFQPYLWRIIPKEVNREQSMLEFAKDKTPYNFVLYEDYFDGFIRGILNTPGINLYSFYGPASLNTGPSIANDRILGEIFYKGSKGVLFTIPRYQDLAMMRWFPVNSDNQAVKDALKAYKPQFVDDKTKPVYLLPTSNVVKLFQGQSISLTDGDIITAFEESLSDPEWEGGHNSQIRAQAKKHGFALVDLSLIYHKINQGNFLTDDGVKIDGSIYGNFFSSDGIYPGPIGHAVIANEVIKAINKAYSSKIPLINITQFAETIK